jgi:phage portal protein BeeE
VGQLTRLLTRSAKTSPKRRDPLLQGSSHSAVTTNWNGRVGKSNVELYRHWSMHSEWVRGAINIRRQQVSSAEWAIVPLDKRAPYSKRLAQRLTILLTNPNPANDSFRSFIEPVIEDLIVLDAGCIEKERDLMGTLHYLWPVDGAEIRVNARWDGTDPAETRYYWYPDYKLQAQFTNDDFIYMMANRRTDSPVGISPLETLKLSIQAELYGHEYNRRQVEGAAPDGVMNLGEGATNEDIRRYRSYFENEVAGRGAIGFIGGTKDPSWIPFRSSNREMQFLEWQIYLVRKIAVVMGLTPQDLGVTFDINRSTAETQIQISEDRGLRPLMALLQDYITQEVIWDSTFGGEANNLAFRFTALNLKETTAKAAINHQALGGVPWKTINEARIEDGREPLKGDQYNMPIMSTPTGAVSLASVPTAQDVIDAKKPEPKPAGPTPPVSKDAEPTINVNVSPPSINVTTPDVHVNLPSMEGMVQVDARTSVDQTSVIPRVTRTMERDERGQVKTIVEEHETPNGPVVIRRDVTRGDHNEITGIH